MGKNKKNSKDNVLSLRVTDKELESLEHKARSTNRSKSDILREALQLFYSLPCNLSHQFQQRGKAV
ncbi:MAG: CopG family transcriptional regulator [Chlorobium sp.]|nr:CopG family transcriptional regulator [Chlorobium sp.]